MEVSSHAIDQLRVEGLEFTVAAFTNLSHEHLDYHGTMEEYFLVKSRLFTAEHSQRAVIWTDDPYGERLAAIDGPAGDARRRAVTPPTWSRRSRARRSSGAGIL